MNKMSRIDEVNETVLIQRMVIALRQKSCSTDAENDTVLIQ